MMVDGEMTGGDVWKTESKTVQNDEKMGFDRTAIGGVFLSNGYDTRGCVGIDRQNDTRGNVGIIRGKDAQREAFKNAKRG